MVAPARHALFLVGLIAIVAILTLLPEDIFRSTQAFLLVASASILLLIAGAVLAHPVRKLLARLFAFGVRRDAPAFSLATEAEWREMLYPVFVALVLLAAAGLPAVVRGFL